MSKPRRLPSGNWRIQWIDAAGKRRSATFKTEAAARAGLRRNQVEADDIRSGRVAPAAEVPLFRDFAEKTFVPECRRDWKYSERLTTKSILANHLTPKLGGLRLDEIRGAAVEELRADLQRSGLQDKTVYNVLTLLRRILRYAQRRELLVAVPHFEMPKGIRQARREDVELGIRREEFLSFEELERLVGAATDPTLRAMVLVGARLGLRAGEIRALQWGDVDRKRNLVTVARAEYRGVVGKPKSGAGRRIPLPARVREALGELPRAIRPTDSVFQLEGRTFTEGEMTALLVAAGCAAELPTAVQRRRRKNDHQKAYRLRRLTRPLKPKEERWLAAHDQGKADRFGWHTLRHTFCTHLAITGTPIVKIQRWAGHADIATTQRYMHWAPAADDARHIDALDNPDAAVLRLA